MKWKKVVTLDKKYDLAKSFLKYLNKEPKTVAQTASEALDVNITTALRLIDDFGKLGILEEITGYKRNRIFSFEKYLKIFR